MPSALCLSEWQQKDVQNFSILGFVLVVIFLIAQLYMLGLRRVWEQKRRSNFQLFGFFGFRQRFALTNYKTVSGETKNTSIEIGILSPYNFSFKKNLSDATPNRFYYLTKEKLGAVIDVS